VRRLSLDANETELAITCVTTQGIPVTAKAVVIYKVGDDFASISNAGRRFLDKRPEELEQKIKNVFEGHLRSIVGGLTVEQMIREREALTEATRRHSGDEMAKLGLVIDSLQIKEIDDSTGYIRNLAAPHAAEVQKLARIAQAEADREATEREQQNESLKAAAVRETQIKKASYQAEMDRAQQEAAQAGPLAEQKAKQEVTQESTKLAELEAARTEKELEAEIRKPADAQAYKERTLAQGDRDARISRAEANAKEVSLAAAAGAEKTKVEADASATRIRLESEAQGAQIERVGAAQASSIRAKGLAEGEAIHAHGLAEAAAIKARAEALAVNQEAVISQQLAERAVDIVAAAARPIGEIDHLMVFNGTEGVQEAVLQSVATGFGALQQVRDMLARPGDKPSRPVSVNGATPRSSSPQSRGAAPANPVPPTESADDVPPSFRRTPPTDGDSEG